MQEKNSFESCIPALSGVECLFNIVSFTIIACIIGAAITTYQYPKHQEKSFFAVVKQYGKQVSRHLFGYFYCFAVSPRNKFPFSP